MNIAQMLMIGGILTGPAQYDATPVADQPAARSVVLGQALESEKAYFMQMAHTLRSKAEVADIRATVAAAQANRANLQGKGDEARGKLEEAEKYRAEAEDYRSRSEQMIARLAGEMTLDPDWIEYLKGPEAAEERRREIEEARAKQHGDGLLPPEVQDTRGEGSYTPPSP